ncbi:MAG: hypothetical protein IT347_01925 [Candidatus Eisenbacteria bacterium]|nr:hypothetical protein [Candidatus Eisenbacteria bacterium]
MNADLQQFVREALARGIPREQIRATLSAARWRTEEVAAELERWADGPAGLPVPRRRLSLSAREAFMHLVMFATLYTFAYSAGAILFAIIAIHLPDAAAPFPFGQGLELLRAAIAACLTAFPIYLWTSWLVGRSLVREPEKRSSGVRRWLTYLTLFIAVLTLIGNFAGLLRNLLSGGLTTRIGLQSLVVFAIAGLVFGHYQMGLRRDESDGAAGPVRAGVLGHIGAIGTLAVLVAGLVQVGSPQQARVRSMDARRVQALVELANQVQVYADAHDALPASLDALPANPYAREAFLDPRWRDQISYSVVDSATYQLVAKFDTAEAFDENGLPIAAEWRHGAGRVTFTRHVQLRRKR